MSNKNDRHNKRLIELLNLLNKDDQSISCIKKLYNEISVKHLSVENAQVYQKIGKYLNYRINGMNHFEAYNKSKMCQNKDESCPDAWNQPYPVLWTMEDVKEMAEKYWNLIPAARAKGIEIDEEQAMKIWTKRMNEKNGVKMTQLLHKAFDVLKLKNVSTGGGGGA
jgi:hypothetical protein